MLLSLFGLYVPIGSSNSEEQQEDILQLLVTSFNDLPYFLTIFFD